MKQWSNANESRSTLWGWSSVQILIILPCVVSLDQWTSSFPPEILHSPPPSCQGLWYYWMMNIGTLLHSHKCFGILFHYFIASHPASCRLVNFKPSIYRFGVLCYHHTTVHYLIESHFNRFFRRRLQSCHYIVLSSLKKKVLPHFYIN